MNDTPHPVPGNGSTDEPVDHDPVLEAASERLRAEARPLSPEGVTVEALRRRTRRLGVVAGVSLAAVAVLAGTVVAQRVDRDDPSPSGVAGRADQAEVERIMAGLGDAPVDPATVRLVSSVTTFADCDALVGDLRRVGAEHVGSAGFGASGMPWWPTFGQAIDSASDEFVPVSGSTSDAGMASSKGPLAYTDGPEGTTLGTNVQVAGVDEPDMVKAVGKLIYDLDGRGNLRVTDATSLAVLGTVDVTPDPVRRSSPEPTVSQILVDDGRAVVLGEEIEVSEPIPGDPSATRASTPYLTVTMVDVSDPAKPTVTDRVRVEGSAVSARLVGGQIRLVTTSNLNDMGFVVPTTPNAVPVALERNRRTVAGSAVGDWIPEWQRGDDRQPLVPCQRVHVPDTFAGVAMTSLVAFPLSGRFEPVATSILAPGSTIYAGVDKVAVSAEVWVDPAVRETLDVERWETAVHEFEFAPAPDSDAAENAAPQAPGYLGSGIVDGSIVSQFAFGEVGDALGVVTTVGTPWSQDPEAAVNLTLLRSTGAGGEGAAADAPPLEVAARLADLADGRGAVSAVRYLGERIVVSTGVFGREALVVDVTDPAAPRRAGRVSVPGEVGYVHPLPGNRALLVGSRYDEVGEGALRRQRQWVTAHLLDVSDADKPLLVSSWERPDTYASVSGDHHAFTWWPERSLAMWGVADANYEAAGDRPNHALALGVDDTLTEVAYPAASQPPATDPPCPTVEVTDPEIRSMLGVGTVVLGCDPTKVKTAGGGRVELDWPRYQCSVIDDEMVERYAPELRDDRRFFACNEAPLPTVGRVLVVGGRLILVTDQTLEVLDSDTFASVAVAFHPSEGGFFTY